MADSAATTTAARPEDSDPVLMLQGQASLTLDESHEAKISLSEGKTLGGQEETVRRPSTVKVSEAKNEDSSLDRDVEKEAADGNISTTEEDPNIVTIDVDDPEHPYQWPTWRIVLNVFFIAAMSFVTPLAASMFAPGVPKVMIEFKNGNLEMAAFVVSVYILGFAAGPVAVAPLSEMYGRLPIYHVCNLGYLAFTIGCALAPNMSALIVFRFIAGVFGSAPVTTGGGSLADMVRQNKLQTLPIQDLACGK